MKRVHLILTDEQHSQLKKQKEELEMTWEEFVLHASAFIPTFTVSGEEQNEENSDSN